MGHARPTNFIKGRQVIQPASKPGHIVNALNYIIILYAFSLPISKAATVLFSSLAIILWIGSGSIKNTYHELLNCTLVRTLSLLLLLSAASVAWSSDFMMWLEFMRKYWHFLIIPVIYTSLKPEYVKHTFSAFLLGMLVSETVSFGIFFGIWSYKDILPSNPSPFMDHINYSIYLALTALILLNRMFFEPRRWMKLAYFLYFIMVTTNLFIIAGRTGQVAFMLGIILIGLINIRNKLLALAGMVLLATVISLTAYSSSSTFKHRVTEAVAEINGMIFENNFTGSLSQRIALWTIGTHVFIENPIIGTGIGNETRGATKHIERYGFEHYQYVQEEEYLDYHNSFVQYAVHLGAPGLIAFISIFIGLLAMKFQSTIYRNINIAFVFTFVMISMGGFSFHLMNSMVLFALFSSTLAVVSRCESTENKSIDNIARNSE